MNTEIRVPKDTFEIPEDRLDYLNERLEKLNRRARKLNLPEVKTVVVAYTERQEKDTYFEPVDGTEKTVYYTKRYFEVRLEGLSPKLPGWTFLATLEHIREKGAAEGLNIVRAVPGATLDEKYRTAPPVCDHCGTQRYRKDTYIIRKDETNEVKQIGRQCIKDYLGHASLEHIGLIAEYIRLTEENSGGESGGEAAPTRIIYRPAFVKTLAAVIEKFGYLSRKLAQEIEARDGVPKTTTASLVLYYLFPSKEQIRKGDLVHDTPESLALAEKLTAFAETIKTKPDKNDFEHNLATVYTVEFLERRDIGLASSIYGVLRRFEERDKEFKLRKSFQQEEAERSNYIGTIGKREVFTLTLNTVFALTVENFRTGAPDKLYIYKFSDEAGNTVVWKTGSQPGKGDYSTGLEEGGKYKVKATVKKHEPYKGIKQTTVNRCALVEIVQEKELDKTAAA